MNVKQFQLWFAEEELDEIGKEAKKNKLSKKEFMLRAIRKAVKESKEEK